MTSTSSPDANERSLGRSVATGTILVLLALSAWLRLRALGTQLPFLDEVHSIFALTHATIGWISTHLGPVDHCIPLTLWDRAIADRYGLGEWALRLPSALGGVLVIVLAARSAWKLLTPAEAILLTASLGLSPYLIYLAREARPYPIISMFFLLACLLAFGWARQGGGWRLVVASGSGVIAVYFHSIVLPACGVLGLYVAAVALRAGVRSAKMRDVAVSMAVMLALWAYLILPFMPSLLGQLRAKGNVGSIDMETVRHGLMLLHNTSIDLPVLFWIVLWSVGVAVLARRFKIEIAVLSVMCALQFAVVWLTHPRLIEVPWIWLRYFAHLIPFLALLSVAPVARLIEWAGRRTSQAGLAALVAALLSALLLVLHAMSLRYALPPYAAHGPHPLLSTLPVDVRGSGLLAQAPQFYAQLATDRPAGALIEVPMTFNFPLYGFYQRDHGRPVYNGAFLMGPWQAAFTGDRMAFRRVVNLEREPLELPQDARFLIHHKDIKEEMSRIQRAAQHITPLRYHLYEDERIQSFWAMEFGREEVPLPASIREHYPVVFEDELVAVYDLARRAASSS